MNVGLVTFHRAHNCGAALQCVALVHALTKIGHSVKVIDNEDIGEALLIPKFKSLRAFIGWFARAISVFFRTERLWWRYRRFQKRFMSMSVRVGIASKFPNEFDCYILGSDQVLHPKLRSDVLSIYLFEGKCNNARCISYASSFGVRSLPCELRERYSKALSAFKYLSVREQSGLVICRGELKLEQEVSVVLDPTLLLDAEEYRQFEEPVNVPSGYVFVYYIGRAKNAVLEIANNLAAQYKLKVVVGAISTTDMEPGWILIDPGEFLYLIRNAKYVVTTSFHGTAFSVINKKPFMTVIPTGMRESDRMINLLTRLGLEDRIVNEERCGGCGVNYEKPDYDSVYKRMGPLKRESLAFLEKALDE